MYTIYNRSHNKTVEVSWGKLKKGFLILCYAVWATWGMHVLYAVVFVHRILVFSVYVLSIYSMYMYNIIYSVYMYTMYNPTNV